MIDVCILGSGIAGSTIANLLSKKYSVYVFDKARGPGGRSSNKRFKTNLSFDHGVQYICPKSKAFKKFTQKLFKKKIEITKENISIKKIEIDKPNENVPVNLKKNTKTIQKIKNTNKKIIKSNLNKDKNYTSTLEISTSDKKIGFLNIIFFQTI